MLKSVICIGRYPEALLISSQVHWCLNKFSATSIKLII